MSDFSKYLLLQSSCRPAELLERLRVTGIVVPNLDPWLLVLTTAHERVRDKGLLVLEVDYAADHGLHLRVFQLGRVIAELKAESEVERRASFEPAPWVQCGLLKRAASQAIARLLARDDWHHEDVRDAVAKRIGFRPVSFLRPEDLKTRLVELRERFPGAVFVRDGVSAPLGGDPESVESAEIEAILEAERLAPVRRVKPPPVEVVDAAEMAELSRVFRGEAARRRGGAIAWTRRRSRSVHDRAGVARCEIPRGARAGVAGRAPRARARRAGRLLRGRRGRRGARSCCDAPRSVPRCAARCRVGGVADCAARPGGLGGRAGRVGCGARTLAYGEEVGCLDQPRVPLQRRLSVGGVEAHQLFAYRLEIRSPDHRCCRAMAALIPRSHEIARSPRCGSPRLCRSLRRALHVARSRWRLGWSRRLQRHGDERHSDERRDRRIGPRWRSQLRVLWPRERRARGRGTHVRRRHSHA